MLRASEMPWRSQPVPNRQSVLCPARESVTIAIRTHDRRWQAREIVADEKETPESESNELPPGIPRRVGNYELVEKIGEGGMGVVYKAEDSKLGRTVALKFMPPDISNDPAYKERFAREAQTIAALDHPNLCTIHAIEESEDGRLFIAMACYDGEALNKLIERGPLPVEEAVDIAVAASVENLYHLLGRF